MQLRILLSIGILSITIIAYQLILMQLLSIVQWYHFAYMIISIALLGFGAAGTFLALFRAWAMRNFEILLPTLMILTGLTMSLVVNFSQTEALRFDSFLLFTNVAYAIRLVLTYLLFFVPFFTGALAIGLVFTKLVANIGRIYFANLVGSGIGGFVAIGLMWAFLPQKLPGILSLLAVLSGIIVLPRKRRILGVGLALLSVIVIGFGIANPPQLILSEYKGLSKTMDLPDAEIEMTRSGPHGLIQLVSTPAIRYAPGLSLNYSQPVQVRKALFENGNWFGPLVPWADQDSTFMMNYTTNALPYIMKKRNRVLSLNAGTGLEAAHSLNQNADEVIFVEPNKTILALLSNELADETDSLYHHPKVTIRGIAARTYLMARADTYDLITLPMIGVFGGASGLHALQEQYIMTIESLMEMWHQLTPEGVISISSWMDYPFRNPLKILATISEMLLRQGVENPEQHIVAIRSWGTITFSVKKQPLTSDEIQRVRDFCDEMFFDPALLPGLLPNERSQFNAMQDERFFEYLDLILSANKEEFYGAYDFNIRPATDNRPYFSQFIKLQNLPHLAEQYGVQSIPFFEIGYLIVLVTLVQTVILAIILIILPLIRLGWKGTARRWTILYFGGLGLGYMFVEIILIQRFTLYFGNPIYSAAAVISFMLVCSGVGSYYSSRLKAVQKTFFTILGMIISAILILSVSLTPILQNTVSWHLSIKVFISFVVIAIPAFLMGIPFPVGLRFLSEINEEAVPWAWGINGCLSVISAALAIVVAVEIGLVWVMVMAAVAYGVTLLANVGKVN